MRTWVEKLAKISKEKGTINGEYVRIDVMYKWHPFKHDNNYYVYINSGSQTTSIKIYQDEYDLLSEVKDLVANNTRDNIIKELENL